jgi:urease accessory protein
MILVGVFAYQLGGRALWLVPLTFVAAMALGGFLGVAGIPVPFVEIGIALSVIVLGGGVAFGVKAPVALAMGAVGAVGIGIGILVGMTSRVLGKNVYRVAGGLASAAGLALLLGYV